MIVFKFLFQSSNIVARTAAQFAVVGMAGSIGVSVAATSASANLDAIAQNDTAQTINAGTLTLNQTNAVGSLGFGKNITNMVPGDILNFNVLLTNGAVAGQDLKLAISDGAGTPLTRISTKSLTVAVNQCVGGTWSGSTCSSGNTSLLLSATPLTSLNPSATSPGAGSAQMLISGPITAGATYSLRFTVTLPSSINESTINGVIQGTNTIQGQTASITWILSETQKPSSTTEG